MVVLSLFDGMSCLMQALKNLGIKPDRYFASEIDPYAIKVSKNNHPDIIHIGDVTKVRYDQGVLYTENGTFIVPEIDLLAGGSPCQGFSSAGKGLNFDDPRSKLFFEFVRIKGETKPKHFLLENVVPKKKEWEEIISQYMGVKPAFINSRLVSAQDRKRLYWCNSPITQPIDLNVSFSDISVDGWFCAAMRGRRINEHNKRDDYNMDLPIRQYVECRMDNKTNCITTVSKDNVAVKVKSPRMPISECEYRYLHPVEMERLQTLPDGYTEGVPKNQRVKMIGNGWTVKVIEHILKIIYHESKND